MFTQEEAEGAGGSIFLGNNSSNKGVDENERIEKIFLDELGTLRREEMDIISKFNLRIPSDIFISNWDENFTFEKNLDFFLKELELVEARIFKLSGAFNQTDINQALSHLRILREKGRTVFENVKEEKRKLESESEKDQ